MLHFSRRHVLPGRNAGRSSTSLVGPGVRVGLVRSWGFTHFDSRHLAGVVSSFLPRGQAYVELVLAGKLTIFGERTWGPGWVIHRRWAGWNERWEGDVHIISVYAPEAGWRRATSKKLGAATLRRLRVLADQLEHSQEGAEVLARLVLKESGWKGDVEALLGPPPPPDVQVLATQLGALLSRLETNPQMVDLADAQGVSVRQVRRHLRAAEGWLGPYASAEGWRSQLNRTRVVTAVAFLACSTCRLAEVAHAVGYGSVRAMLRAFRNAGLPAPSVLRGASL
ncbi:MAG: hypothetical protein Q8L48_19725 [Archangium sp.]|nr:hypothetical protein [Archangium sp.]